VNRGVPRADGQRAPALEAPSSSSSPSGKAVASKATSVGSIPTEDSSRSCIHRCQSYGARPTANGQLPLEEPWTTPGGRVMLALDASGSMSGRVLSMEYLNCREASAAMALVTAASESNHGFTAFAAGSRWSPGLGSDLSTRTISPRRWLDDVVQPISGLAFGGTDCALRCSRPRGAAGLSICSWCTRTARPGRGSCTRRRRSGCIASGRASRPGWSWSAWRRTGSALPTGRCRHAGGGRLRFGDSEVIAEFVSAQPSGCGRTGWGRRDSGASIPALRSQPRWPPPG
jgi:hypothetical protein